MSLRENAPLASPREQTFRAQLLAWYDAHARALPWRESHDPYRVWLSEVMLQQTRVAAVIAHYHEFLRRFPTVEKLARAREASVLAAWSGLGYYRRARMLHAAAKVVARGGEFPETASGLRKLPGVGRYTSAAIASIAFGEAIAVVDGNVERVLQRYMGRKLEGEEFWLTAEMLLDRVRPGDFNQAMMELGATVCTPRAPACLTCPVVELCATRGEMPGGSKAAQQKKREIHYALGCRGNGGRDGAVFLVQRPGDARLMAGMWELPEVAGSWGTSGEKQVPRFARNDKSNSRMAAANRNDKSSRSMAALDTNDKSKPRRAATDQNDKSEPRMAATDWNDKGTTGEAYNGRARLFTVRHSITVTDYTVHVWRQPVADEAGGKWITSARLGKLAMTGLARKILRKAGLLG